MSITPRGQWTNFTYNAAGQFATVQRQYDNSGWTEIATSAYTYDSVGRLEQLAHTRAAGATDIATYAWTFDAADRILSFTNSTHSAENVTAYDYDDTNQVTGTDYAAAVDEVFAYDANGNRQSATTQSSGSQTYDAPENNRVTDDGVFTYVYDDEGNRIQRNRKSGTGDDAVTLYTWDHRNRLTRVINKNSGGTITMQADYVYDMFNHRIAKVVDADGAGAGASVSTLFVYDGNQIALQFSGSTSGSLTHRYLYGPAVDMLLADEQTSSASAGTIQTPLADHLGTIHDVVATNGAVGYHAVYDTFGHVTSSTGSTSILFGFTSQAYDTETGLSYHWNRYYDVIVGSWISEDPIGFGAGDSNLHRYVFNSSIALNDPSGHEATFAIDGPSTGLDDNEIGFSFIVRFSGLERDTQYVQINRTRHLLMFEKATEVFGLAEKVTIDYFKTGTYPETRFDPFIKTPGGKRREFKVSDREGADIQSLKLPKSTPGTAKYGPACFMYALTYKSIYKVKDVTEHIHAIDYGVKSVQFDPSTKLESNRGPDGKEKDPRTAPKATATIVEHVASYAFEYRWDARGVKSKDPVESLVFYGKAWKGTTTFGDPAPASIFKLDEDTLKGAPKGEGIPSWHTGKFETIDALHKGPNNNAN